MHRASRLLAIRRTPAKSDGCGARLRVERSANLE